MRVLVTGGRDFSNREPLFETLDAVCPIRVEHGVLRPRLRPVQASGMGRGLVRRGCRRNDRGEAKGRRLDVFYTPDDRRKE